MTVLNLAFKSTHYVDTCEISGDVSDVSLTNVKYHRLKYEIIHVL